MRKFRCYCLLLVLSVAGPCSSSSAIQSFRAALVASHPLVNSLSSSGAINREVADRIIRDFDEGAVCAVTLQTAFARIPKDAPDAKARKLNASVEGLRCFKVIVSRQNFASHPRVQQAAAIAEGILASLVVFYSEPGEMRAQDVSGRPRIIAASADGDEQDLERKLRQEVDKLKQALEP